MKAILATNLSKTYWYYEKEGGIVGSVRSLFRGKKVFVEAVKDLNINVEIGELIGFIGPNGAGKTTTLKMLSGILHPTSGQVEVMGFFPFEREKQFLRNITFVAGQRSRLFWDLPADDYFSFCKVVYEIPDGVYEKNLSDLVELAEIGDILKVPQRKLSFGQRKRCELVAAMLHDPKVIFLDEPTNALDLTNARKVREFIKAKGTQGRHTVILTSHIISDIEQVCDRVVIINHGAIVFDGKVADLKRLDGFKKEMKIVFDGQWSLDLVERHGKVKQINSQEVLLEVEPDETSMVASHLFSNFPIKDIAITDPPLEKIIESIYQRGVG